MNVASILLDLPPCPTCLEIAGQIDRETVMPLPPGAAAPLSRYGRGHICHDCEAAENLQTLGGHPMFVASRVTVSNERQEHFRLPRGVRMGLVLRGSVRPAEWSLKEHHAWLDKVTPGWDEVIDPA